MAHGTKAEAAGAIAAYVMRKVTPEQYYVIVVLKRVITDGAFKLRRIHNVIATSHTDHAIIVIASRFVLHLLK